ncbi:MAG: GyrI-like domain-containing protein [Hyphomicrobiales bacterium]|nr:GyrI-like domain-containing protein [Hyphomicrobiales bacterium]
MISPPQIVQTQAQPAAVIHLKIPRSEMMKEFGPAVGELMAALTEQGVAPTSAVFAHHLTTSAHYFDFELGVTVASRVKPAGRVNPGELPAARVARTIYTGPYEGLFGAWGAFDEWMNARGLAKAPDLWEVYETGPQTTPDPAGWRTELNRPLV